MISLKDKTSDRWQKSSASHEHAPHWRVTVFDGRFDMRDVLDNLDLFFKPSLFQRWRSWGSISWHDSTLFATKRGAEIHIKHLRKIGKLKKHELAKVEFWP
jgi:hypothetical protein